MSAQTEVVLRINHFLGTNEFGLDVVAHNDLGQAFKVSRCAYCISKFTVIHDGGLETDITEMKNWIQQRFGTTNITEMTT